MKKTVREGVFETNSSSQHSLVIKKVDEYFTKDEIIRSGLYLWKDGSLHMYDFDMTFDRSPFKCLQSFKDKWQYCLAALGEKSREELEAIIYEYVDDLTSIEYPITTDLCSIDKMTEEELVNKLSEYEEKYKLEKDSLDYWVTDENNPKYWYYERPYLGYAEDYGMLSGFLKENNISLKEFLLNKKYIIICDGDEYCIWGDLKDSGLINKNEIDYEYPKAYGEK